MSDLRFLDAFLALAGGDPASADRHLQMIESERFRQWCQRQQVAGLTYLLLEELPEIKVPEDLAGRLREDYLHQWATNERLRLRLAALRRLLQSRDQEFIVLKGLTFAERFYGATDRRATGDLDILVPSDRALTIVEELASLGLRKTTAMTTSEENLRHLHHVELDFEGTSVELHHALRVHPTFEIDEAAVWADRRPVTVGKAEYMTLSDEHALLLQLLGLHTDVAIGQVNVRWFADLFHTLLALSDEVDWGRFLAARHGDGTQRICVNSLAMFLVLTRSDDYFPTLAEALQPFRDEIVLEPDRLQYLNLLRGSGALDRKMWTLRQYQTSTSKAVFQWLGGMPRRIAAKPAAFVSDVSGGETQSIWEGERHDGLESSEIAVPSAELPATVLRLGSATIEFRYSRAEYLEATEELFRLKPSPDNPAARGPDGSEHVDAVVQIFDHVPVLLLPRRPLVERPLEDLVELQEDAVTATVHRRRKPMEIFIAVDFARTERAHRLHCLMVVLNKILATEGTYHLHAAAVRVGGRTSLFVGGKGSGKSTLRCALGRAGATVLSEDHVFLREDIGRFLVSGCDSFLRLTPEVESYFFARALSSCG